MKTLRSMLPVLISALLSCGTEPPPPPPAPAEPPPPAGPTAEEAHAFAAKANEELRALWVAEGRAAWANATDITPEHEEAESKARQASMEYLTRAIPEAARLLPAATDPDARRQLHLLRLAGTLPAPKDPAKTKELADITTKLGSMYGAGKACDAPDQCRTLGDLEKVLASSRKPDELEKAWKDWHGVAVPMRPLYGKFVELGNEGAREIGFNDMGEIWRSGYDMTPAELEAEVERLWQQVKPLYEELHCHTRATLSKKYGEQVVPPTGPIPAHLLGNMWSQSWENIYPLLEPFPKEPDLDPTAGIQKLKWDDQKMTRTAEAFFTSIGLDPLPDTFWERSMFTKPKDREVVCHASAWDVEINNDLRIKMCIEPDYDNLVTLHHELGHNYYYHYYYTKPVLFQQGAHDGFHEAVGDAIALSMTPGYLKQIGLIDQVSDSDKAVVNYQMQVALSKVAFMPFGKLIDQWRWDVFSGKIAPADYNAGWWKLRTEVQGITPPGARDESLFDAGAKYHIPGNTPYLRYFLAHILQFQFHQALCESAGHQGPLHTCSIYGNQAAGKKLQAMLEMGSSRPWPDALEALAGTRQMDAGPMLAYFEPLRGYLREQNAGRTCGW